MLENIRPDVILVNANMALPDTKDIPVISFTEPFEPATLLAHIEKNK